MSSDEPEKARATGEAESGTGATDTGGPGSADAEGGATAETGGASETQAEPSEAGTVSGATAEDGAVSEDVTADDSAEDGDAEDVPADAEHDTSEYDGADDADTADSDAAEDGDATAAAGDGDEGGRTGPPRWALLGAAAFATAAFVVAAVFGGWWLFSATGDDADIAAERQDVTNVAGQAVTAFTELDHTKLDEYFNRQKDLSTGQLANQIKQAEKTYREAITKAKSKVTTTVHDVAVSELNQREGKASAIVAASSDIKRGQQQGMKTMRLEVQLSRDGEDGPWKVSQIGDVPVTGGGQQ